MSSLKVGVALPTLDPGRGPSGVIGTARLAEQAGLDAVSVPDVLVGDATPALEAVAVLAAVAAATERVRLDFGVLALPARPVAWLAAQVQTLQHLSGNRVRLGVGLGGFPGSPFWRAVGAPEKGRGKEVDAALALLPRLVSGEPVRLDGAPGQPVLRLAPAAPMPPVLVGGGPSEAVLRRAAVHGDAWLPSALSTGQVAKAATRLRDLAAEHGRPAPRIHLGVHAMLGDGVSAARRAAMLRELGGFFGLAPDQVAETVVVGGVEQAAERFAAYAEAGVDELVLSLDGEEHDRQVALAAEARSLL